MPKIPICPISLPCTLEPLCPGSKRFRCLNFRTCEKLSYAWVLPYEYNPEEKYLLVTTTPTKLKYVSGEYEHIDYDDPEFTERIRYEWEKAGWARPVINKNYTGEEEDIGIPF